MTVNLSPERLGIPKPTHTEVAGMPDTAEQAWHVSRRGGPAASPYVVGHVRRRLSDQFEIAQRRKRHSRMPSEMHGLAFHIRAHGTTFGRRRPQLGKS
jgi:hypothetical protein